MSPLIRPPEYNSLQLLPQGLTVWQIVSQAKLGRGMVMIVPALTRMTDAPVPHENHVGITHITICGATNLLL